MVIQKARPGRALILKLYVPLFITICCVLSFVNKNILKQTN